MWIVVGRMQRGEYRRLYGGRCGRGADQPVCKSAGQHLHDPNHRAARRDGTLSNTTPIGVTRGPGFAEAVNVIERLIDQAARQCGFDRAELRRRNMVPVTAMPMTNALGFSVDSGDFAATFDRALALADVAGFAARRSESEARGLLRGLGLAYHIKGTGGSPHENVDIRFEFKMARYR